MGNALGLIELVLVFTVVIGWSVFELVSLRRKRPPPGEGPPP